MRYADELRRYDSIVNSLSDSVRATLTNQEEQSLLHIAEYPDTQVDNFIRLLNRIYAVNVEGDRWYHEPAGKENYILQS